MTETVEQQDVEETDDSIWRPVPNRADRRRVGQRRTAGRGRQRRRFAALYLVHPLAMRRVKGSPA